MHLEIPVHQCEFPAAGRYGISLRFSGGIAFRPLEIRAARWR